MWTGTVASTFLSLKTGTHACVYPKLRDNAPSSLYTHVAGIIELLGQIGLFLSLTADCLERRYKQEMAKREHRVGTGMNFDAATRDASTRVPVRIEKVNRGSYASRRGLKKGLHILSVRGPGLDDGLPLDVRDATLR